eukprot:gene812-1587_t
MARIRNSCSSENDNRLRLRDGTWKKEKIQDKKDVTIETTDIGGFTLMFKDPEKELKWRVTHQKRHIGMSKRYLFACALYQGLFFCKLQLNLSIFGTILISFLGSDVLEGRGRHLILVRISLGLFSFLGCLLIAVGVITPRQTTDFHLYLSTIGTVPILHTVIVIMFMYISYSAEKSSRERWLLKDRLIRENINLQMVASSIQEDLKKAANERRPFHLDVFHSSFDYKSIQPPHFKYLLSNHNHNHTASSTASNIINEQNSNEQSLNNNTINNTNTTNTTTTNDSISSQNIQLYENQKRVILFFKGLAAWAICMGTGYAFDLVSLPVAATTSEVNSSAAFALLMHSTGFSIFLLYFTGQIRWLALNGIMGFSLLWIFNSIGMENKWVVFSTHSIGYIILITVIIIMILIFGGVVLVWTYLVDFLKDVLIRYPQVKDDLSQKKVLEQVILRCLSDLPSNQQLLHVPDILNVYMTDVEAADSDVEEDEEGVEKKEDEEYKSETIHGSRNSNTSMNTSTSSTSSSKRTAVSVSPSSVLAVNTKNVTRAAINSFPTTTTTSTTSVSGIPIPSNNQIHRVTTQVLQSKRPGCCYFCLRDSPIFLLPAYAPRGIPMCTPYTEMAKIRETLTIQLKSETMRANSLQQDCVKLQVQLEDMLKINSTLQLKIDELTELKRLYKSIQLRGSSNRNIENKEMKVKKHDSSSISSDTSKHVSTGSKQQHHQQQHHLQQHQSQHATGSHGTGSRNNNNNNSNISVEKLKDMKSKQYATIDSIFDNNNNSSYSDKQSHNSNNNHHQKVTTPSQDRRRSSSSSTHTTSISN